MILRFIRAQEELPETECPACGYVGRFTVFGLRIGAGCPQCGSAERHRLLALAMRDDFFSLAGRRVLHFAAEPSVVRLVEQAEPASYIRADINPAKGVPLNIEAISLPDGSADVVIASHILEHVDDRKALAEIHRVLAPGGQLVAMVPIIEGWTETYENGIAATPEARALHYGQHDHVRFYGRDFRDRVRGAGFELVEYTADGPTSVRHALLRGEKVFLGTKATL